MARLFAAASLEYLDTTGIPASVPPMTFACRVKFTSLPTDGNYMTLLQISDHDGGDNFAIHIGNSGGTYFLTTVEQDDGANFAAVLAFAANTTDWFHLTGVLNDTTRECYVGGSGPGTDLGDGGANATGLSRTVIGAFLALGGPFNYLDGAEAEACIYDTALNAAEIASLGKGYSPLFIRPQSLQAYWSLIRDEDQDRVGGHNMTAYNTPSIAAHPPVIYPAVPLISFLPAVAVGNPWYAYAQMQ